VNPGPTLSIVIPAYNEQDNVPLLHQAIVAVIDPNQIDAEIIFIDDGSKDGTWAAIEKEVAIDRRVRGLKLKQNCGETAACDAGLRNARGRYVMTMDADLQNDPKDIPRFLEALAKGFDCVCGTRVESRGEGDHFIRVASSRIANAVRNKLSQEQISDAGCTYRAFRRECVEKLKLYRGLHRFIPTLLKMEGFTVTEIPVSNNPRLHGESKYGVWNRLFKSFHDLLAIRWMKSRLLGYDVAIDTAQSPRRVEVTTFTASAAGSSDERGTPQTADHPR
jgi:glycosyltransferase involved in cell wall biosynthesis